MFKVNDLVMFVREEPFNLREEPINFGLPLMGIVTRESDPINGLTKVEVIFADGLGGFGEWFYTEELINIKEIDDKIYLPSANKLWEKYMNTGVYMTKKQTCYIAWRYDLWLEEQMEDIITYI